ncbi:hypothetical protein M3223_21405 [Paenibacillus pasadenensis]|uniref:hypothetical protein n=1 Tax=Paenibacillus pasadenensis TaxID=217090 RepID=UPI00203DF118|nr:hypothetical protein [Paenibacillus pasadenensis]MCM3749895.1 hypothetical protein [Paenibacillus pasadenensis]
MNPNRNDTAALQSNKRNINRGKPCSKPEPKNCLILFTPLQAEIFGGLLDGLIASIQSVYVPPSGPLPNVFKVLQNLYKDMRLSLRDQAGLFAATELPITAYEQSDGWSPALISAIHTALTKLYSFSLLACVSSPVKDSWTSKIRLAETNLADISGFPPVTSGIVLSLDGGDVQTSLSFSDTTSLPTEGAIPITGFTSGSIPVMTDDIGQNPSIVLADNSGGNNFAFSMPGSGILTGISARFTPDSYTITGTYIVGVAQLCRAEPGNSPYAPFTAIPGTLVQLVPGLTGNISGRPFEGSLSGLNIPLNAEDRLVLVFTLVATIDSTPNVTTIQGTLSGSLTIDPSAVNNEPPLSSNDLLPFASNKTVGLTINTSGIASSAGIIGYGFMDNEDITPPLPPISVTPDLVDFTSPLEEDGVITAFSAYFGVDAHQTPTLPGPVLIFAQIYQFSSTTNQINPLELETLIPLGNITATTITQNTPGVHALKTELRIPVFAGDRFVLVFTAFTGNPAPEIVIQGWASGGITIGPAGD